MLALTILLLGLVVVLIMVTVLMVVFHMANLLVLIIPLIPLLMMIGSGVLGLIELFLFLGSSDDRKIAKRDTKWLFATFVVSGVLLWVSSLLLWKF